MSENEAELTVLAANMHVGQAMGPGFAAQVHLLHPDIVFMSEVVFNAPAEMRKLFSGKYLIVPDVNHLIGREADQTPALLLKERFNLLGQSNAQVSAWRGGGDHDRLWPTRFATQFRAVDLETNRIVNGRPAHTWALGANAPAEVTAEHERQVDSIADWAKGKSTKHIVLTGGDMNENLDSPQPPYAVRTLGAVGLKRAGQGMHPADAHTSLHGPIFLDDVFYKGDGVKVKSHTILRNAGHGADHKMVLVRFAVTPLVKH